MCVRPTENCLEGWRIFESRRAISFSAPERAEQVRGADFPCQPNLADLSRRPGCRVPGEADQLVACVKHLPGEGVLLPGPAMERLAALHPGLFVRPTFYAAIARCQWCGPRSRRGQLDLPQ